MTSTSITVQDRCRGVMVGLAVGNLLGIRVEGWPRRRILGHYPDGVRDIDVRTDDAADRFSQALLRVDDDDLAQAIVLAEACVDAGTLTVDDLVRRFWVWGEENGVGMGVQTRSVLARYGGNSPRGAYRDGTPAREPVGAPAVAAAREVWEATGRRAAGNGAVMRCAPVAVRRRNDDAALVYDSVVSAVATHWDPRCVWSTVVVNLAVASLLRGATVETAALVERAQQAVASLGESLAPFGLSGGAARMPDVVVDAVSAEADAPADIGLDGFDMGYTLKAMQVALWCARRAGGVEDALTDVINAGGDTDTNGAVAGAVLGARFGCDAIPARWREHVAAVRAGRDSLEAWADRLMAAP